MSYVPPLKFDTDTLAQMRQFWEDSDLSAKAIGKRFGVTKNVIVGQARRRGWEPRAPSPGAEPSNVFIRLDAVHAKLDAVLAETRPFVEDREKRYEPVNRGEWTEARRLKAAARLRALGGNKAQRGVA